MAKAAPRDDIAAAVARLADELLDARTGDGQAPAAGLDRLRRRLRASEAVLWLCDGNDVSPTRDFYPSTSPLQRGGAVRSG
jgi:hypothetical protein